MASHMCALLLCAEADNVPWLVLICTLTGLFRHLHHTSLVSLLWLLPDESGEKKKKHLDNKCKMRWYHFMYYMGVVEKTKSDKSVCMRLSTTRQRPRSVALRKAAGRVTEEKQHSQAPCGGAAQPGEPRSLSFAQFLQLYKGLPVILTRLLTCKDQQKKGNTISSETVRHSAEVSCDYFNSLHLSYSLRQLSPGERSLSREWGPQPRNGRAAHGKSWLIHGQFGFTSSISTRTPFNNTRTSLD